MLGYSEIAAYLSYKIILLYYQDVQVTVGILYSSYTIISIMHRHLEVRE